MFSASSFLLICSTCSTENIFPSIPIVSPGLIFWHKKSVIVGVSGNISLYKVMSVPSNCWAACKKYRESVHNPALSSSITTVPAEPVKPEIHSRIFQCGATYSLRCGSVLGIMKALIDLLLRINRSACMRSLIVCFILI